MHALDVVSETAQADNLDSGHSSRGVRSKIVIGRQAVLPVTSSKVNSSDTSSLGVVIGN